MRWQVCEFSKFFRGSMPPDPLQPFLLLDQFQVGFAEKRMRLKKCGNYGGGPVKISRYTTDKNSCRPTIFRFFAEGIEIND